MAIYLGNIKLTGTGVQVDDALSSSSANPVENKAVTNALTDLGYSEWQKPADWMDIRSGALENSIYLLVGHSADYSQYPKFALSARVSNSGTYDVYVDGVKQATTAHNTVTELDFQTLALSTGWDVTTPSALRTHIIRITPTVSTNTLTGFYTAEITGQAENGLLWAHYQLSNALYINTAFGIDTNSRKSELLQAVTAKDDKITFTTNSNTNNSGLANAFFGCISLVKIPLLEASTNQYETGSYAPFRNTPLKKVVIKNNSGSERIRLLRDTVIKVLDIENGVRLDSATSGVGQATGVAGLKQLPHLSGETSTNLIASGWTSLQNTFIDDSFNTGRSLFRFYGTSTDKVLGLKGLIVSNAAPFDGASPQINVSYTGLDRAALVNLFNSLPTVTGSQVCTVTGATGANDLTASDLAVATDKGWTVTR